MTARGAPARTATERTNSRGARPGRTPRIRRSAARNRPRPRATAARRRVVAGAMRSARPDLRNRARALPRILFGNWILRNHKFEGAVPFSASSHTLGSFEGRMRLRMLILLCVLASEQNIDRILMRTITLVPMELHDRAVFLLESGGAEEGPPPRQLALSVQAIRRGPPLHAGHQPCRFVPTARRGPCGQSARRRPPACRSAGAGPDCG